MTDPSLVRMMVCIVVLLAAWLCNSQRMPMDMEEKLDDLYRAILRARDWRN